MSKTYGYSRISTPQQHDDRQRLALLNFGVPANNIFTDQQSGKDFQRPAYQRLLRKLKTDDTLVVKSIDRLGRNYSEIIEQWRIITKEKKAAIVILDMPLLDTRREKDLIGTLLADVVLQLLSYVAETERDFLHQRAARERGVKFGRPAIPIPDNFDSIHQKWLQGKLSARQAAKILGISHVTFLNWTRK